MEPRNPVSGYMVRPLTFDMVGAAGRFYGVEMSQSLSFLDDHELDDYKYERYRPYVSFYSSLARSKEGACLVIDLDKMIFYLERKTGLKIVDRRKDVIQETLEYMSKGAPIRDEAGDLFFIPVSSSPCARRSGEGIDSPPPYDGGQAVMEENLNEEKNSVGVPVRGARGDVSERAGLLRRGRVPAIRASLGDRQRL